MTDAEIVADLKEMAGNFKKYFSFFS